MFNLARKAIQVMLRFGNSHCRREPRVVEKAEHGIDPGLVSVAARRTCESLRAKGYEAYIVGGAVRDLLLGVKPKDFDVATNATPEQVKRSQKRAYIVGHRFRIVHAIYGNEIIECSTFRALDSDGVRKDEQGRIISDNVFGEMWEDAARRDFTINAMYYDPLSERVFDYHNGMRDLRGRRLRVIGDPEERYREDPVRMMRAVRIAGKLGFSIDPQAERAIPRMAHLLENIPAARLFDEMMKLFTCGHAEPCMKSLIKEGLNRPLLPMLDVMLEEPGGEEFLMLALRRTDERIAQGKRISPAFMFATLLWPQVKKRWEAYENGSRMPRGSALFEAVQDVLNTQGGKIAINRRFTEDMRTIWMLQLRFERRTGKNPRTLVQHPKYRAGYDFLLLRSLLGQVPSDWPGWWEHFAGAGEEERNAMIDEQQRLSRVAGQKARAGSGRLLSSGRINPVPAGQESGPPAHSSEAPAPFHRRRRRCRPRRNKAKESD